MVFEWISEAFEHGMTRDTTETIGFTPIKIVFEPSLNNWRLRFFVAFLQTSFLTPFDHNCDQSSQKL
jgi:hypothetical protein